MRETTSTVVIGAGQAGLAVSRCLTARGIEHVVLDRGRVAERWRSERWDSLRLLTPNWMTRLPGFRYDGPEPDGFMTAADTAEFFTRYAATFAAPVREFADVVDVAHDGERFTVDTTNGEFTADHVVIATGWCDRPAVPAAAGALPQHIHQVVPTHYHNPDDLPPGGVLVVGASATGVQLADELHASGRPVTLAVGTHLRMPRTYRGMDCFWWLDQLGVWDRTVDDLGGTDDVWANRTEPALQLAGRADRTSLDLPALQRRGIVLAGRLAGIDGTRVRFAGDLASTVAAADARLTRLLGRIDAMIDACGLAREVLPAEPLSRLWAAPEPDELDLPVAGIRSVVWATGYRREYPWLRLPILDGRGEIAQYRGVTAVPGAYVLGQRFQHYRNSNFIDGVGRDAAYVAAHLATRVRRAARGAAPHPIGGRP